MRDFLKICSICGEVGHQDWQCSKEALITFQSKVCCKMTYSIQQSFKTYQIYYYIYTLYPLNVLKI